MKVRASRAAQADLKKIADFIARDNVHASKRVRARIRRRIETLSDHPERGQVAKTVDGLALRRLIEGPFLIFYLIQPDFVLVTRIMRGSRDVATELRREPGQSENE